ncbi:MAG: tetratricopeptide repeat protein [Spirochaetales bacterium]|uniref:Tetratricopeptide repeat protein n=1 Tax=Candidatus Thalassospirochaeta sargassi TaxID=3119039 RepID=A0AAJ1MLX9_9SPIO|nr:tetratricopeptide repeat protein [Spirochaetales bacterium]
MLILESYVIIPIIASVIAIIIVLLVIKGRKNSKSNSKLEKARATDRNAVIKEANRRLAQNPKDPAALLYLAELHFQEKDYEKAFKLFDILLELCATDSSLDEFDITLKHATCAINSKQYKAAYKSFMLARATNPDLFTINYNLGYLEYLRKNYEKSAGFLNQAKNQKSEDASTYKYLGLSLYKMNRYSDAHEALKKALELDPDNKELIFAEGECLYNLGQSDAALKMFASLRNDARYGAHACIYSGTISMKFRNYDQAAMYFELGLKNPNNRLEMKLELQYRLATCYIKAEKISNAIGPLEYIVAKNQNYKDAAILLRRYGELDTNLNLKIFLMGDKSRFINMCRKLISLQFPGTRIKVLEVASQQSDYIDMTVDISSSKWEDVIIFRFIRSTGQVGELIVRDLYGKIKEVKAGRGICISAGAFSSGAKNFVEARLIDLIEKEDLVKLLKKIEATG